MSKKYFIPGVDQLKQMVETPASKERTDKIRFILNTIISAVSAVAAIAAAVLALLTYLQ